LLGKNGDDYDGGAPAMDIEKLVATVCSQANVSRHITKSVMTPMILVLGITVPLCFGFAYLFRDDPYIKYPLMIVGVLTVLVSCVMYLYFAFTKPERLQSEDYQIQQQTLQMISKKAGQIVVEPIAIGVIAHPVPPPHEIEYKPEAESEQTA
jgi:SNF family Na+-dependent transporter